MSILWAATQPACLCLVGLLRSEGQLTATDTAPSGSTLNSPQIVPVPLYSRDGTFQRSNHNSPFSPPGSLPSHPSPVADMHFNPDFDTATQNLYDPPMPSMPDDSLQMEHIFYYFEHVRQLQYAFAGNSVANITYSVKFSLQKHDTSSLTVI